MRKLFFVMVALLTIGLTLLSSCKKDDDNSSSNDNNMLIGVWKLSSSAQWTFDGKYLLIEDEEDVMNGEKTVYNYNNTTKDLELGGGFIVYKVSKLTATEFCCSTAGCFTKSNQ